MNPAESLNNLIQTPVAQAALAGAAIAGVLVGLLLDRALKRAAFRSLTEEKRRLRVWFGGPALTFVQLHLLHELQRLQGRGRVLVNREGQVLDWEGKITETNLIQNVLKKWPSPQSAEAFERLVQSIPAAYLKTEREQKFSKPYSFTVSAEGAARLTHVDFYLDEDGQAPSLPKPAASGGNKI